MVINFISLKLQNYKSHRELEIQFGDVTRISGENAMGKSSIPEAITFTVYGTDVFGGRLDPTPLTYAADETLVQLLLSVDGKQLLLGRGLKKGKASYYINEVPSKAKEFEEIRDRLFDKDLFLSLFNPSYFFTRKWDDQREMLLKYVPAPSNKEVLKHLPELQTETLGTLLKKHSLIDIEKIHCDNKKKKDKEYIAAQSRTKTLQEQLENIPNVNAPIESIKAELAQIDKQVREIESQLDSTWEKNQAYNNLQSKIRNLQDQIEMSKERWPLLKNEVIEETCCTCQRPLDESSVEAVKDDKDKRIEQYKANHNALIKQRDELKKQLSELEFIDVSDLKEQLKIDEKGHPLRMALQSYSQVERLQEQIQQAKDNEAETLKSLNESIFVLDSIKAFNAKSAELQAEKVQALFTTLSIRLFKINKTDGEIKPDFEIEKDEKPYRTLSLSEGIRAGLELRDVLSQQSDLVTPCFVDNAESITSFKEPNGQLIISKVVAGQELKIERVDN